MSSKHIIFIHGCGPKPPIEDLERLIREALVRGLRRDDAAHADRFDEISMETVYFADQVESFVEPEFDPALDIENRRHCLKELSGLNKSKDFRRRGYDGLPGKTAVQEFLVDAGASLGLGKFLVKRRLPELHSYLDGDAWGSDVRLRLKTRLQQLLSEGADIMLVGHCLGSVIAFDALWSLSREDEVAERVTTLVTLGSPLSDNGVQRRLLGASRKDLDRYPNNLVNWFNLSAEDDYVCHDKTVSDDFKNAESAFSTDQPIFLEPQPELYAQLATQTRVLADGLVTLQVLDQQCNTRADSRQ